MKNLTKIFVAVAVSMFAFACVQDTTEDLGVKVEGQGVKELTLSLEESRTHLGDKVVNEDGTSLYPLYWSEGDAISVNGVVSLPLAGVATDATSATFQFYKEVSRPLCVVYPASAAVVAEDGEDVEPAPVVAYPVNFLATQPYTVGSFAPQAAPMYGYAAALAEGEEEAPVQLNHLTGVIRLALKGNGEKVTSIKVKAEKGAIAGPFTVDCTNGTLTAQEGASNTVTVTFAEPLVLGAEAAPIYLTVPAGKYGTFVITVNTEAHQKMTVKFSSDVKPINAGAVREFAEFEYTANSADVEDGDFIIDGKDALIEFARIASTFFPRTKAVVTADIDMTGYDWKPIEGFGAYEFDGGEFAIKGLNASLFGATEATIKNVKLVDVNINAMSNIAYGVIAHSITNGGLENCSASGKLTYNYTAIFQRVGGLVGHLKSSSFFGCTNDMDITIVGTVEGEATDISMHFGGLVGWLENPTSKITNCVNNGTILGEGTIMRIDAGGFIGYCDAAANIENCHNHGEMLLTADLVGTAFNVWVGFIGCSDAGFEAVNPEFTIANCSNTADITFGAKGGVAVIPTAGKAASTLHVGGFHGYTRDLKTDYFSVKFTNCTNRGNIEVNCLEANATKVSGLLSQMETDLTMDKCKNMGNLSIVRGSTYTPYIAGFICHMYESTANEYSNVVITNSSNEGKLYVGKEISHTGVAPQAGIIGYIEGSTVHLTMNEVHNKGEITLAQTTSDANPYFGGLIGYNKGELSMENCSNTKAMTIHATINEQARNTYVGGIIGYNGPSENKLFKNVNNSGDITVTGACQMLQVGGIFGSVGNKDITIDSCTNSGDITIENAQKFNCKNGQIGGILGVSINAATTANLLNCTNSGDITVKNTTFDYTFAVGGICGQAVYNGENQKFRCNLNIENATNEGDILIENSKTVTSHISAGGIVAAGNATDITTVIKNPIQRGNITVTDSSEEGFAAGIQVGGIAAYLRNGSITNDSAERGTVSGHISVTTKKIAGLPYIAGIIGSNEGLSEISGIKVISTTTNPSSITANIGTVANNRYFAGLVGYNTSATAYSNLSNAAPINVTLESCTNGTYISGCFGRLENADIEVNNCSNSGDITLTAKESKGIPYFGGICGGVSKAKSFASCTNSGAITFNATNCTVNTYFGGILGFASVAVTLESCSNSGAITYNPTKMTGTTNIGGIVSTSSVVHTVNNCFNAGAITLKKGTYGVVYLGGAIGYANYTQTEGTGGFHNCYNKGAITLEDGMSTTGNIRMGGFNGYHKVAYDTNVANYGDIYVGATTTKQILLGGLYGYSGSAYVMKGGYVNTGNITITGGTGTATGFAVACGGILGTFYNGVENAINTGNITMSGNAVKTDATFGGIVGYSYGNGIIKNCQSYCTIKAFEKVGDECVQYIQSGLITGSSRRADTQTGNNNTANARTAVVRDCKVGGEMIFSQVITEHTDVDAGGDPITTVTVTNTPGVLTEENWFNHIYGGTTDWSGVTGYDGCERLAAAPKFDRLDD